MGKKCQRANYIAKAEKKPLKGSLVSRHRATLTSKARRGEASESPLGFPFSFPRRSANIVIKATVKKKKEGEKKIANRNKKQRDVCLEIPFHRFNYSSFSGALRSKKERGKRPRFRRCAYKWGWKRLKNGRHNQQAEEVIAMNSLKDANATQWGKKVHNVSVWIRLLFTLVIYARRKQGKAATYLLTNHFVTIFAFRFAFAFRSVGRKEGETFFPFHVKVGVINGPCFVYFFTLGPVRTYVWGPSRQTKPAIVCVRVCLTLDRGNFDKSAAACYVTFYMLVTAFPLDFNNATNGLPIFTHSL